MTDESDSSTTQASGARIPVGVWWVLNLVMLISIAGWIALDGRALGRLERWPLGVDARLRLFGGMAVAFSFAGIAVGLINGPPSYRSLKAWFALTALLSAWCALYAAWPSLYWFGQAARVQANVPAYIQLALELRNHWPERDGQSSQLGDYRVYHAGDAQTLLPMGPVPVPGAAPVAAVERTSKGPIRFQMAGAETGAWVEWHPTGTEPASFVGGLENRYQLERQVQLRPEWYLVRYRED